MALRVKLTKAKTKLGYANVLWWNPNILNWVWISLVRFLLYNEIKEKHQKVLLESMITSDRGRFFFFLFFFFFVVFCILLSSPLWEAKLPKCHLTMFE